MKRKTLNRRSDFISTQNATLARSDYFMVRACPARDTKDPRYGLVVSKNTFKKATQRNRVKRLMRDWIAFNEDLMIPELDYVFFTNFCVLDCDRETGRSAVKSVLNDIAKNYVPTPDEITE